MRDNGNFIGNYRILRRLSSHITGELYLVEHTFHTNALALLLRWPSVELSRDEDRAAFLQRSTRSRVQHTSAYIPLLDADIDQQHPYIVTAYNAQAEGTLQEHLGLMEPVLQSTSGLQPNDSHTQTETFLRIFSMFATQDKGAGNAEASTITQKQQDSEVPHTNPVVRGRKRISAGYQRLKPWQRIILAILIVALIGWGSFALYMQTPAWAATILITPVTKTLNQSYKISVSAANAATNTILGRKISFTSRKLTQTIAASGKGHHKATAATGNLVISQIHLDNPTNNMIGPSTLTSLSGVAVTTEGDITVSEGGTVTQHAHANQPGSGGNIGANDFNFPVQIVSVTTNAQKRLVSGECIASKSKRYKTCY